MPKQTFKYKKDCKHSVVYEPVSDTPENPALTSSVYISRLVLPRPTPNLIELSVEFPHTTPAPVGQGQGQGSYQ